MDFWNNIYGRNNTRYHEEKADNCTELSEDIVDNAETVVPQEEPELNETDTAEEKKEDLAVEDTESLLNNFVEIVRNEINSAFEIFRAKVSENAYLVANSSVDFMRTEIKDKLLNVIDLQQTTIQKQHQIITKFQEDLIFKLQKPLIMEIIGIADNIRMILDEQSKEKNYDTLLEAVKDLENWVQATLSNNSVRKFRETDNSIKELNRKCQELIDVEETDDPDKNNTYVSERPGYFWTMPYLIVNSDVQLEKIVRENNQPAMFTYVIRPEEVVKLKYKKEND